MGALGFHGAEAGALGRDLRRQVEARQQRLAVAPQGVAEGAFAAQQGQTLDRFAAAFDDLGDGAVLAGLVFGGKVEQAQGGFAEVHHVVVEQAVHLLQREVVGQRRHAQPAQHEADQQVDQQAPADGGDGGTRHRRTPVGGFQGAGWSMP